MPTSNTARNRHKVETPLTLAPGIRYPTVQGALSRISHAGLAAAVSNSGGPGQVAIGGLETPHERREMIRKTKSLTDKPFAVNIPISRGKAEPWIDVTIEER